MTAYSLARVIQLFSFSFPTALILGENECNKYPSAGKYMVIFNFRGNVILKMLKEVSVKHPLERWIYIGIRRVEIVFGKKQ